MITNIEKTQKRMDVLADRTRDAVGDVTDRAEQGVEAAAAGLVERAHEAKRYISEKVETATRDVHAGLDASAKAIDRGYTRARADMSRATNAATGYVSENPRTAIMIAASAGFVLGVLAHRHRAA